MNKAQIAVILIIAVFCAFYLKIYCLKVNLNSRQNKLLFFVEILKICAIISNRKYLGNLPVY